MAVKPFVKWAGGKSQLIKDIRIKYPKGLGSDIVQYCEPFVGGGAVLFDILSNYKMENIIINDINNELINTYLQVQLNVHDLICELDNMQCVYWAYNTDERKVYYYNQREHFNTMILQQQESNNVTKAALFIFLNKTCFNGLYRVNSKGLFNVPMGMYIKPTICDKDNLLAISNLLQHATITCGDYKQCAALIDAKTFVYIDPPYRPLSTTANFTSYTETPFDDKEQIELGNFVNTLHSIGAKIVISNSDPKNIDEYDSFFDDLYKQYHINRISAKRMINSNASQRGSISELLISNF